MLYVCQLFQGIDIGILETFCSRIGRGDAQPFGSGYGTDNRDVSFSLFLKIMKGGSDHSYKSCTIGF